MNELYGKKVQPKPYEECYREVFEVLSPVRAEATHLIIIRDDEPRCTIDPLFVKEVEQRYRVQEKKCLERLVQDAMRSFEE